jgi:hypothetical protein
MNTFLASWDLKENASLLDNKRLLKQLIEGKQILDIIVNNKSGGWSNHIIVKIWKNSPWGLFHYIFTIWQELQKRKIAVRSKLFFECQQLIHTYNNKVGWHIYNPYQPEYKKSVMPLWFGRADILKGMRSRLKCKGEADRFSETIKKHLKLKNINNWLLGFCGKLKNELNYADVLNLKNFIDSKKIKVTIKNHYGSFRENPRGQYIFPI